MCLKKIELNLNSEHTPWSKNIIIIFSICHFYTLCWFKASSHNGALLYSHSKFQNYYANCKLRTSCISCGKFQVVKYQLNLHHLYENPMRVYTASCCKIRASELRHWMRQVREVAARKKNWFVKPSWLAGRSVGLHATLYARVWCCCCCPQGGHNKARDLQLACTCRGWNFPPTHFSRNATPRIIYEGSANELFANLRVEAATFISAGVTQPKILTRNLRFSRVYFSVNWSDDVSHAAPRDVPKYFKWITLWHAAVDNVLRLPI